MPALKKIPFFLLLLALFFCLHGSAENFGSLTVKEVVVTGLSVLIFTLIIFAVCLIFTRNIIFSSLVTFFIGIWFFFFGAIHDFVKSIGLLKPIHSYTVFVPLLVIATIAWIIFLKKKRQLWPKLAFYFNLLLIIYCVIDIGRLAYKAAAAKPSTQDINFNYAAVTQKPDVFFLLLDGYPGQKSLTDSFHFSNEALYNFLAADSFKLLPIASNYNITQFSMSSILNMNYIKPGYDTAAIVQKDIQARQKEINDAAAFSAFEKMGYQIENNSIFDVKNSPGIFDVNGFILGHNQLLTDKIFLNRMNRDIGAVLPKAVIKMIPFLKDQSAAAHKDDNLLMEERLHKIAGKANSQPVFCYSHFLMPHGHYYFDSTGRRTDPAIHAAHLAWMNRDNFISYLKYTNGVLKKLIQDIRQKRPGAIIIVMSDHGFREYKEEEKFYQPAEFENICAVYFPNKNYGQASDSITNVNFFRYLFNAQFGQGLTYLPDHATFLTLKF